MLDIQRLRIRAAFFQAVRRFFETRGYLEVDTPIRHPLVIPEQHIQHIPSSSSFLQSSPELYMKRLLALGGCEKIFQICHCFREGERGRIHLEEFMMLEWYAKGADYTQLMKDCEDLIRFLAVQLEEHQFPVAVDRQWEYLTVTEAFAQYSSISSEEALERDCFDEVLVEDVEPHLGTQRPTILYDYPLALASLARPKPDPLGLAERFELYVAGVELANGFSELTDALVQRQRFQQEHAAMAADGIGQEEAMPEHFLSALEEIDEAAGIAMGLDRLLMLFMGMECIGEIVSFAPEDLDS